MQKSTLSILFWTIPCFLLLSSPAVAHTLNPKIIETLTGEVVTHEQHEAPKVAEADPRDASRRLYTLPEWHIVYTALEYSEFVSRDGQPSAFPFFKNTLQLWWLWGEASRVAQVEPDPTTNTVLWTIALSTTFEQGLIGLYESTIGAFFELVHFGQPTAEELYVNSVAVEYAQSLNHTPWYLFPYGEKLRGLWSTWRLDSVTPRAIERRLAFTLGYGVKATYAGLIAGVSQSHFEGSAGATTQATVLGIENAPSATDVKVISRQENNIAQVELPRYRAFTSAVHELVQQGVTFVTIQNHAVITASIVKDDTRTCTALDAYQVITIPILSQSGVSRVLYDVPVLELHTLFFSAQECGLTVEHLYDF